MLKIDMQQILFLAILLQKYFGNYISTHLLSQSISSFKFIIDLFNLLMGCYNPYVDYIVRIACDWQHLLELLAWQKAIDEDIMVFYRVK